MTTKQVPLVETLAFAANATRTLPLEKVGLITDLMLRVRFQYDNSSGAPNEDALARIIKGIAIRDGQGHSWWACGDGRQLHWLNFLQFQGQVRMDVLGSGAVSNQIAEALWRIHFGVNPLNLFDPSSGIPAAELGSLALEITWGSAAVDFGSTISIDSGTVTVTPATILAGPQYNAVRRDLLLPNYRWEKYDIPSVLGELGLQRELPAGNILRGTAILVVDTSDDRSDVEISEVGYRKVLENTVPWRENWNTLLGYTQARFGLPALPSGIAMVNWGQIIGEPALDLRRRLPGQDVLGFTSLLATGDIWLLHQAYAKG